MSSPERSRARAACLLFAALVPPATLRASQRRDLTSLSLEELLQTKVVSVSKQEETRLMTPAAVHVVTADDVRQSGARTLPEALGLSPGVHAARNTASQWAIGIRGFTGTLARSQLALIDGRSLYTPLFAGTYWDVQDVLLDDVERIEVVRGPGGTLWGANAVNGIVNVITRSARDTQGGFVAAGAGNEEHVSLRARYGGRLGGEGAYRVYGKYFDRDAAFHPATADFDGWHQFRGGVRADWRLRSSDTLTVQGDAYNGRSGQRTGYAIADPPFGVVVEQDARLAGGNLLARWTRSFGAGSQLSIQTYYDRTEREEASFREDRDTFDVDGQYRILLAGRHEIVAGAGARLSNGETAGVPSVVFEPAAKTDDLVTAFVQDSIDVVPGRLRVVLGTKIERNDYTGIELQPSARVLWRADPRHSLWAAVTRAVRTPSRVERDLSLTVALSPGTPAFARVIGSDRFTTERALAFEAGYRAQPSERLVVDLAVFHTRYPNLISLEPGTPFVEDGFPVLPLLLANGIEGRVSGVETAVDARPAGWLVLRAGHDYLNMALEAAPGSADTTSVGAEDASPRHRFHLRASFALPGGVSFDTRYRWIARLPAQDVPAYSELDARLAWRPREALELALVGHNLLQPHHAEFGSLTRIERSLLVEATWAW